MAFSKGFALLSLIFLVHLAGIYLFTTGFLLRRLSLPDFTQCADHSCVLESTHKRAVLLIIDALRFDFVSSNPPVPHSPFHHNVLTVPRELTAAHPQNSFLFNAYSDPPTATLQRIKALTTGSLPTFLDIGSNFGGSSAIAEDSLMKQLRLAGKRVAFMGDDTWMSVYPESFALNMTFPEDSFNVEDLHTVDNGVIRHMFPLLEDESKPFDFLLGHFLGVDHVGHRVGPDHPSMRDKLKQMDDVLRRVVSLLDEETLLVVLGDHGMDRSGDHGGDGDLETSSAMWVYSKGPPLSKSSEEIPSGLLEYRTFPKAPSSHRWIQQIDIVPSLSLLLGLPIPFNNLGRVIPELFWRGNTFTHALSLNVVQIKKYLDAYRASASGSELNDAWENLLDAWSATQSTSLTQEQFLITMSNYTRVAVASCRAIWAQFNPVMMGLGLVLLAAGIVAGWAAYSGFLRAGDDWDEWLDGQLMNYARGAALGSIFGFLFYMLQSQLPNTDPLDICIFGATFMGCVVMILTSPPTISSSAFLPVFLLILHSIAFTSNSFTFWEDRMVPFLLVSSLAPFVRKGISASNPRLRYRILGFSVLFAVCVRLMSMSTVCREEQQPYCHVTFYTPSAQPPTLVLYLALPVAIALPWVLHSFLKVSRSHLGLAKIFLPGILMTSLVASAGYWLLEWLDSAGIVESEVAVVLRVVRTWIARSVFVLVLVGGGGLWWTIPLCLDIVENAPTRPGERRQVTVIGYANAFGSPYLLLWSGLFAIVYLTTLLTGQLIMGLMAVALLSHLEVVDSARDVRLFETLAATKPSAVLEPTRRSPPIAFADIVPLALLGLHAFYATGHQATIPSIQWKSAFMLTPTMSFSLSASTVFLNSIGTIFLAGLAVPLLALWNRSPLPSDKNKPKTRPDTQIQGEGVAAALGVMTYYACLLLGAAVSSAILRRHLMVWKVFAPRFMLAVAQLVAVDLGVLIGFGVGVQHVGGRVTRMFRMPVNAPQ
ncbi:GPI ethanolamine phosphate transferase 3 [Mycena chlorophos]|uniref:GPI ethanolamine phosphate transferase 3 n=1 Tax=Mycena chlorophos TaxID=658473 RepID=A0A8H6TLX1_MYCCL|nr:GPI ethanolamine phosphate transferase 3 [Mycena chlorophos]